MSDSYVMAILGNFVTLWEGSRASPSKSSAGHCPTTGLQSKRSTQTNGGKRLLADEDGWLRGPHESLPDRVHQDVGYELELLRLIYRRYVHPYILRRIRQ